MALDRRRDVADVLGLIAGARDPELVDIDVEAGAVADAHAAADPDARTDSPRDHRRDRHALGGIAEERNCDAVGVPEIRDEAEPAPLAHIIHDEARGLLRLVLASRAAASEQAAGIEGLTLRAEIAVDIWILHLAIDAGRAHAGERHRPHAKLPIAHMHGDDESGAHLVLVAADPMAVGDVQPARV